MEEPGQSCLRSVRIPTRKAWNVCPKIIQLSALVPVFLGTWVMVRNVIWSSYPVEASSLLVELAKEWSILRAWCPGCPGNLVSPLSCWTLMHWCIDVQLKAIKKFTGIALVGKSCRAEVGGRGRPKSNNEVMVNGLRELNITWHLSTTYYLWHVRNVLMRGY